MQQPEVALHRPLYNLLLKLEFVNAVCIFEDNTPKELIKLIRPNFLVKGGDYKKSKIGCEKLLNANAMVI